jgi:hypothetical protein
VPIIPSRYNKYVMTAIAIMVVCIYALTVWTAILDFKMDKTSNFHFHAMTLMFCIQCLILSMNGKNITAISKTTKRVMYSLVCMMTLTMGFFVYYGVFCDARTEVTWYLPGLKSIVIVGMGLSAVGLVVLITPLWKRSRVL